MAQNDQEVHEEQHLVKPKNDEASPSSLKGTDNSTVNREQSTLTSPIPASSALFTFKKPKPSSINKAFLSLNTKNQSKAPLSNKSSIEDAKISQAIPAKSRLLTTKISVQNPIPSSGTTSQQKKGWGFTSSAPTAQHEQQLKGINARQISDEELKNSHGIHLAKRLEGDELGWDELDDDDEWGDTIEFADGTKIVLSNDYEVNEDQIQQQQQPETDQNQNQNKEPDSTNDYLQKSVESYQKPHLASLQEEVKIEEKQIILKMSDSENTKVVLGEIALDKSVKEPSKDKSGRSWATIGTFNTDKVFTNTGKEDDFKERPHKVNPQDLSVVQNRGHHFSGQHRENYKEIFNPITGNFDRVDDTKNKGWRDNSNDNPSHSRWDSSNTRNRNAFSHHHPIHEERPSKRKQSFSGRERKLSFSATDKSTSIRSRSNSRSRESARETRSPSQKRSFSAISSHAQATPPGMQQHSQQQSSFFPNQSMQEFSNAKRQLQAVDDKEEDQMAVMREAKERAVKRREEEEAERAAQMEKARKKAQELAEAFDKPSHEPESLAKSGKSIKDESLSWRNQALLHPSGKAKSNDKKGLEKENSNTTEHNSQKRIWMDNKDSHHEPNWGAVGSRADSVSGDKTSKQQSFRRQNVPQQSKTLTDATGSPKQASHNISGHSNMHLTADERAQHHISEEIVNGLLGDDEDYHQSLSLVSSTASLENFAQSNKTPPFRNTSRFFPPSQTNMASVSSPSLENVSRMFPNASDVPYPSTSRFMNEANSLLNSIHNPGLDVRQSESQTRANIDPASNFTSFDHDQSPMASIKLPQSSDDELDIKKEASKGRFNDVMQRISALMLQSSDVQGNDLYTSPQFRASAKVDPSNEMLREGVKGFIINKDHPASLSVQSKEPLSWHQSQAKFTVRLPPVRPRVNLPSLEKRISSHSADGASAVSSTHTFKNRLQITSIPLDAIDRLHYDRHHHHQHSRPKFDSHFKRHFERRPPM